MRDRTEGLELIVHFGNCELDSDRRELHVGTETVHVEPQVFDLLRYLIANRDRVIGKDELIEAVWHGRIVSDITLNSRINAARRAIGDSGQAQAFIRTLPRKGVRFVGSVREVSPAAEPTEAPSPEQPTRVIAVETTAGASAPPSPAKPSLALPERPSIAVLPFQNMSGDPEQDYFADGVVEEIITALSRFRQLFVIARNSSFTYKGRAIDVKQVGRELRVRYVLEGSVRRAASRVRIIAQLIDAQSGGHLWANRFQGAHEDIFDLQDQMTASVVGAIVPKLEEVEFHRIKFKPTESLDAYDCYLRAMMYFNQWTKESISEALKFFSKSIELDPEFASAHGFAAWCYTRRKQFCWMEHHHEMSELERLARRAITLANDDAVALYSGGWALVHVAGSFEEGAAAIERASMLNPNMTNAWHLCGWTKIYLGESDTAIEHFARAMRLNPLDPYFETMETGSIAAHFLAGRYEKSSLLAQAALQQHPSSLRLLRVAAASYAFAEKITEAKTVVTRICKLDPTSPLSRAVHFAPFRRPEDVSRYRDALQKAGLPE
jgi:TolB-like protein/Tfp pilus assembly protein PilF